MTATDHLRAARHHRLQAEAELISAHFAAEHGDAIRSRAEHEKSAFHLECAHHHEVAATHARLATPPTQTPA